MIKIKNIFRKQKPEEIKFHPKLNLPIKFAFECGGENYYQLVNDYEMPKKRFAFAQTFYQETQNKITSENLVEFCDAIMACSNKGENGKAYQLADELKYRSQWLFDPDTLYRFASAIYFTLQETITDYDMQYNQKKIDVFKKKELLTRFLELLMNGRKILSSLSNEDLQTYLRELQQKKEKQQRLISETKA